MNAPYTDQTTPEAPLFDPFPAPQTMPAGWDLSAIVSGSSLPDGASDFSTTDEPLH
jgi:hypothetical protein